MKEAGRERGGQGRKGARVTKEERLNSPVRMTHGEKLQEPWKEGKKKTLKTVWDLLRHAAAA